MLNNNISTSQVVTAVITIPVVYYLLFKWKPRYFKKHGVKGPFGWPLIGNSVSVIRNGFLEANKAWSREYGKVIGVFEATQPVLLIADPDLLQQIMIKDFYIFTDRRQVVSGDPIIDNFLTVLKGDHWRHVRHLLSPTFSTGKLKRMSADMNACAVLLMENLTKVAEEGTVVNLKERCGEFTMDVIARTHFGIEIDTQKNPNSAFVRYAKKLFQPTLRPAVLIFIFFPFLRPLMRYMRVGIFPRDTISFFKDVVLKTMEERKNEKDQGSRTDFLQLMLNAKNDQPEEDGEVYKGTTSTNATNHGNGHKNGHNSTWDKKGLSENEILAQAILFLLAGYETTAATLSFVAYNLALYPECQEKLFSEVESVVGDKEIVDFDMANNLTYMDQCINETLRIFPAAIRTDRQANEDTSVAGIPISKGMSVGVQIYAIHHDPDLWPDPEKFDPERFTPEAMASHHPMQYLPFGQGPRMCIGMRLAQMEIKVALAHMIKRFRFVRCPETDVPMQFTKMGLLQAKNGVKVKLEFRS